MSEPKYLPDNKENKLYSPKNIVDLITKTKNEEGNDENFYKNPQNNKVISGKRNQNRYS